MTRTNRGSPTANPTARIDASDRLFLISPLVAESPDKETGPKAEEVAQELYNILHHPRAAEIFANEWVQDSNLPIPSIRAILLLFSLLGQDDATIIAGQPPGEVNLLEFIASGPEKETLPVLLAELRKFPLQAFAEAARREASFHQSDELLFTGSRAYEWTRALRLFTHLSFGGSKRQDHGARAIARRFLEALLLRAVLHRDAAALRGLADAMEGSTPQPPVTNRIASEICGWLPRLSSELGREPTKGAMKAFLTEMYPYFADANATTWSDAWKLAGWSTDNDRKGPRNHDDAIALAKRLK